jgi:hypothetical protein
MEEKLKTAVIFSVLLLGIGTAQAEPYANAKYGFSITVPDTVAVDQKESDAGDGISSHSADGQAQFIAYGQFLLDSGGNKLTFAEKTKESEKSEASDGWKILYRKSKGNAWAVFSGQKNDRIFYARAIAGCHGQSFAIYRLEYPVNQKAAYDLAIKTLNASLIDGGGCQ